MSRLSNELRLLGKRHPSLQPHLRAVLAEVRREAARVRVDPKFQEMYRSLQDQMKIMDDLLDQYGADIMDSKRLRRRTGSPIIRIANLLHRGLSAHILEDRDIPRRDLKRVERSLHKLMKMARTPNKPGTWWAKNRSYVQALYDTRTYRTRDDEDSNLVFDLEGFQVFNTIRAEGQEVDEIKNVVQQAVRKMRSSGVNVVPKLLYGKLKIVGKIQKSRTLAWYSIPDDDLSVRTRISSGLDAVHSVIHELGHRWWNVFLDGDTKQRWRAHHRKIKRKPSEYPLPDEGERLGIPTRGNPDPIVQRVERDRRGQLMFFITKDRYIKETQVRRALKEKNFPTRYAASDVQEHFCESFAMFCLGTLNQDHEDAFAQIVLGRQPPTDQIVPVVEESADAPTVNLTVEQSKEILNEVVSKIGESKRITRRDPIRELGRKKVQTQIGLEIETTESILPYQLTIGFDSEKNALRLDVYPKSLSDDMLDDLILGLSNASVDDMVGHLIRILDEYEHSRVEEIMPDARIIDQTTPKPAPEPAPPASSGMSEEGSIAFLEDVVKSIGQSKYIETADKPKAEAEGTFTDVYFEMETPSGNVPYTLSLSIKGDTLHVSAEPDVFDGSIKDKTLKLSPSDSPEDVAQSLLRLLAAYEDGLYDMMSF